MPQHFNNPANPDVHRRTTARGDLGGHRRQGGHPDLGRGETGEHHHRGVSEADQEARKPSFRAIAVEPVNSPVIAQKMHGQDLKPGKHKLQGLGAGFIPDNLNMAIVDDVVQVTRTTTPSTLGRAAWPGKEGMPVRHQQRRSAGRRRRAGRQLGPENAGKLIVVVLPDLGERYLSTLFPE